MPFKTPPKATRSAGLGRLADFVPRAGKAYGSDRNYDFGPGRRQNVSGLSPYIRHRLITEINVLEQVLANHSASAAEKFIQEVCWRTYWKGWLEMRPEIWTTYQQDVAGLYERLPSIDGYAEAVTGNTGIACFDAWAQELVETGYMHNHARMWFASIWIFTLKLPWQLGADFFLRHLLDGCPASNTLGWRWVGGLQTVGKTYLARPDNIQKYSGGRFDAAGCQLASHAEPLQGPDHPPRRPLPDVRIPTPGVRSLLVLGDDDVDALSLPLDDLEIVGVIGLHDLTRRSPGVMGYGVTRFASDAVANGTCAARSHLRVDGAIFDWGEERDAALAWIADQKVAQLIAPYAPVGPGASVLKDVAGAAGLPLSQLRRDWDEHAWPNATKSFFNFRKSIPALLNRHVRGQLDLDLAG